MSCCDVSGTRRRVVTLQEGGGVLFDGGSSLVCTSWVNQSNDVGAKYFTL